jgi:hypothetical protein
MKAVEAVVAMKAMEAVEAMKAVEAMEAMEAVKPVYFRGSQDKFDEVSMSFGCNSGTESTDVRVDTSRPAVRSNTPWQPEWIWVAGKRRPAGPRRAANGRFG